MPRELTPKQRAFAEEYAKFGNACEAYRKAYNTKNMGVPAITIEASRLRNNPNVAIVITELRSKGQRKQEISVEYLTAKYQMILDAAYGSAQYGPAITAVTQLGKLHGLLIEPKAEKASDGGVTINLLRFTDAKEPESRNKPTLQLEAEIIPDAVVEEP